jgi:hypothetical protein
MGKKLLLPKTKCCVSTTRCDRCPIRMLKEGTLPAGYGVRKRELVRLEGAKPKKVKKADLAVAVRQQQKFQKKSQKKAGKKKLAA